MGIFGNWDRGAKKSTEKKIYSGGHYIGIEGEEGGELVDHTILKSTAPELQKNQLDLILEKIQFPNVDLSSIFKYYQEKSSKEQFTYDDKMRIEMFLSGLFTEQFKQKEVYTTDLYYIFVARQYINNNLLDFNTIAFYNDLSTYTSICSALCSGGALVQDQKWALITKIYKRINKDAKDVTNSQIFETYSNLIKANLETRFLCLSDLKFILSPDNPFPPKMLQTLHSFDVYYEGRLQIHFNSLLNLVKTYKNSEARFEVMTKVEYLDFIRLNLREVAINKNGFKPNLPTETKLLNNTDKLRQELHIILATFIRQMIDPNKTSDQTKKANPPQIYNSAQLFYFIEYFPEFAKNNWETNNL